MNWIQVILAAGRSSRMGFPKALVTVDGRPLISRQVEVGFQAGAEDVFVVTGYHESRIRSVLQRMDRSVKFVRNTDPEGDQTSSLKAALGRTDTKRSLLMQLVDHPVVRADTLKNLLSSAGSASADVHVPTHRGRRGHPPLYRPSFLNRVRAMEDDVGINHLYGLSNVAVREVELDDPTVLVDLDTPSDLREFRNMNRRKDHDE
jgi:molybdenum cofactor cytidylyltransferase